MKNRYMIVKKTHGEIGTEVYYEQSLEKAILAKPGLYFTKAAGENDFSSEWVIAEVFEEPISKTDRLFYRVMDWLRNFGS